MKRKLKELMNRALRKEEGFTLVEIIVVIVIMAILAAIAIPSVLSYINDANQAKYIAEARAVYLAIQVEETKYNAVHVGATSTVSGADGEGNDIFDETVSRLDEDASGLALTDASYTGGVYTIGFTSADGSDQTATVAANKEVTITTGTTTE